MTGFLRFLQYNNAVPIAVAIMIVGAGSAFAATDPSAILSTELEAKSVDNSYIMSADVQNRDFRLAITAVTEDSDNYYVDYTYKTITLQDYVWQEADVKKTLTVSKEEIAGKDLGVFVAKQLGEVIDQEQTYLVAVQKQERDKGPSAKVVATSYSGLIGKFLTPHEDAFPGYDPVVAATTDNGDQLAAANSATNSAAGEANAVAANAYAATLGPSRAEIDQMIQQRVKEILSGTASTSNTADTTPPADTSDSTSDTASTTPSDTTPASTPPDTTASSTPPGTTGTSTPPDTGASSTPPVATPPDTSSPPPVSTDGTSTTP